MVVNVTGRHLEITPAIKAHATERAEKLLKYLDTIQMIDVVLDSAKEGVSVEIKVSVANSNPFVAHHGPSPAAPSDAYACIDQCAAKVERQLHEHKDMHRNRKHL